MQRPLAMNSLRAACLFLAVAMAAVTGAALAQRSNAPPPMPANAAPPPLPAAVDPSPQADVPPPAAGVPSPREEYRGGTDDEPQVTTIRKDTETVEEVRVCGVLQYVRVTPRRGRPYYLV